MAIKGLSIPVFGKYNNANGTVTYTDGMINPHAISYSITVEGAESNPLYGDNRVVEDDTQKFSSGTLTLETDDLTHAVSAFLLGAKEIERTYGDAKKVKSLVYDDNQESPVLGFGIIEEHQNDNVTKYKAVMLKKVTFNIPEDAATTRKDRIEWQTRSITGNISRSDEESDLVMHPWKEDAWFDTESEALVFLKSMLGVTAA